MWGLSQSSEMARDLFEVKKDFAGAFQGHLQVCEVGDSAEEIAWEVS
jgi:hypothetical protein